MENSEWKSSTSSLGYRGQDSCGDTWSGLLTTKGHFDFSSGLLLRFSLRASVVDTSSVKDFTTFSQICTLCSLPLLESAERLERLPLELHCLRTRTSDSPPP